MILRQTLPFHPGVVMAGWILLVAMLPALHGPQLAWLAGAGLVASLSYNPSRLSRLLWRNKVVFVSIALLYSVLTPGEPFVLAWPWSMLSTQGMYLGGQQLCRLIFTLSTLSLLLSCLSRSQLITGLMTLAGRIPGTGDGSNLVIRLTLVLDYIERFAVADRRQLQRELLAAIHPERVVSHPFAVIEIRQSHFVRQDWLLLALAVAICGFVYAG